MGCGKVAGIGGKVAATDGKVAPVGRTVAEGGGLADRASGEARLGVGGSKGPGGRSRLLGWSGGRRVVSIRIAKIWFGPGRRKGLR